MHAYLRVIFRSCRLSCVST